MLMLSAVACSGAASDEPRELFADVFDATPAECPNGGDRIAFGYDDDANGALSPAEIVDEAVVCDGAPGEDGVAPLARLIATANEAPGEDCPFGGLRVSTGVDANGDGNLDADEVSDIRFVCGASTDDVRIEGARIEPGAECSAGGTRIRSFRDANEDGVPQPPEIIDDVVLCDPARSLVRTSTVTTSSCARGGVRIDVGLDDDADGTLATTEIDQTSVVCNRGAPTIVDVRPEPAGASCTNGGHVVRAGEDDDDDGVLDTGEIDSTSYVCSGSAGVGRTAVRVDVEASGANCLYGGHALRTGPDDNANGALDPGEVTNTTYLCHTAARASLVTITAVAPGATCAMGGQRIDAGLDVDGDLSLDASEITSSATLCDGGTGGTSVQILTTAVSPARVREPYAADIVVAGGTAAYDWTIASGALPPGLRLVPTTSGAGRIEGLPSAPGTSTFALQVNDASGGTATRTLMLEVGDDLVLNPAPLPTAELGVAYTATITVGGATTALVTNLVAGTLPAGLSLGSSGNDTVTIAGTPTERRTTTVLISVTSGGLTATAPFTIGFAPQWVAYEREDVFNPQLFELGATFIGGATPGPQLDLSGMYASPGLIEYERSVVISPTQQRLIFPDYNGPLKSVTFLGSTAAPVALVHGGVEDDFEPVWSPSGGHVAYEQRNANNDSEVWTAAVTPTGYATPVRAHPPLGANVDGSFPVWSPDGAMVAFYVVQSSNRQLYLDDVTDAAPGFALHPSAVAGVGAIRFSPDSRYVYFVADLDTVGQRELYRVDLAGATPSTPQRTSGTMTPLGDIDDFALSPAGDRLLYIADANTDGRRQLFVVDLVPTIGAPRLVSHANPGSGEEVYEAWWSPDGRAIAFGGDLRANDLHELFLVGARAGATIPFRASDDLVVDGDVGEASFVRSTDVAWAPDGRRLFYLADATTPNLEELWSVDLRAAPFVESVSRHGATAPDVDAFEITADGRRVKYTNINNLDAAVSIDGPTLSAPLVPSTYFTQPIRRTVYLRDGRIAATGPDGVYLLEPATGATTPISSAQNGETYLWAIAPP